MYYWTTGMYPTQQASIACLSALLLLPGNPWVADAQELPSRAYVSASRAALRSQPAVAAPVVDYLTTNTEVEVQKRTGDWCAVRVTAVATSGFIACALLGETKLTIGAIEAKLTDSNLAPRERLDWQSRAFWVGPSLNRLEAVGHAMEDALLSTEVQELEFEKEQPMRPPNAEFDAMKRRLEQAVTVTPPVPSASKLDPDEPPSGTLRRASLPRIRPSYFRNGEPPFAIALGRFTLEGSGEIAARLTDALSAAHGASFRTRVASPVGFAHFGAIGVWDIRALAVTFGKEVTVHGITGRGMPTALRITSLVAPVGQQPCSGSNIDMKARPVNGRWRSAIVAWVGKPAPQGKAIVTMRQAGGAGKYDKLVIETIDLDADGVADFSLWAGVMEPVVEPDIYWKAVFGNVDGKWVLLAFNQEADCT